MEIYIFLKKTRERGPPLIELFDQRQQEKENKKGRGKERFLSFRYGFLLSDQQQASGFRVWERHVS